MQCKKCLRELSDDYFIRTKKDNKYYYTTSECKLCKGIEVKGYYIKKEGLDELFITNDMQLSKECDLFLKDFKIRNGDIDELSSWKINHFYTETFGYHKYLDQFDVEEQLTNMWIRLMKLKIKLRNGTIHRKRINKFCNLHCK